jgi:hypothetical protein
VPVSLPRAGMVERIHVDLRKEAESSLRRRRTALARYLWIDFISTACRGIPRSMRDSYTVLASAKGI